MKKRILSLVLCAVMLLSMCLFMGAGVAGDAAEAAGEVPQTAVFTEARTRSRLRRWGRFFRSW